jgi:hypothetical protein
VDDCSHAVTRRTTGCDIDERQAICAKYGGSRGLGASRFAGRRWYSLSRRAISTGAAKRPRATQTGAATFRPQQSRSEQMSPTRARPAIALTLLAGRVNLEVRAAQSQYTHERPIIFGKLDRLPEDGERVAGRAGVFVHPTAKGSRPGGWKEPFAPFIFERALLPLVARGPDRAAGCPAGASRLCGAGGEGNGAAAEHEEGDLVLRSLSNFAAVSAPQNGRRSFRAVGTLKAVHRSSFRP